MRNAFLPLALKASFSILFLLLFQSLLFAQKSGIKGRIVNQKGEPVSFASVGVEKVALGSMANENGDYQLDVPPGNYTLVFHCIGYQTVKKQIDIRQGYENLDISLSEVVITTKEVTIASRNEDPAYSIMRKAIARAKINQLLLDSYKTQIYIRGSGRVLDLPFAMMYLAKKNGFDENTVFFTETLEELEFKQPKQYKEKVIAARSTAGSVKINQRFLKEDLYNPMFASTTSPLSPRAFGVYRFEYLGAFTDRGHEVFKIKVIPKIKSQNVWEGEIYLIDQLWCIHSAHLKGIVEGFDVNLAHTYSPLEGIWLPVQIKQEFRGSVLGIEVEFKYNASLSKYRIVKNEKLYAEYQKIEEELDEKVTKEIKADPLKLNLKKLEKQDKKILKKMAREYLKEKYGLKRKENAQNEIKEPKYVNSNYHFEVDSNATKKDSTFWLENRAVPLTAMEINSFHKLDSIRVIEEKKDSSKKKRQEKPNHFGITNLLTGKHFKVGKLDSLKRKPIEIKYFSPFKDLQFNPVEGYATSLELLAKTYLKQSTSRTLDNRPYLQFGPTVRYSHGRQKWIGSGQIQVRSGPWEARVSAGTEVKQFNENQTVNPAINSLYALLDTRNFMKLYEADFGKFEVLRRLTNRVETQFSVDWANRIPLTNTRNKGQWGTSKTFESNQVAMPYVEAKLSGKSISSSFSANIDWYPTLVSSMYNDRQYFRATSSPRISLQFTHAIPGISGSKADFTSAGLSVLKAFSLSDKTDLHVFARSTTFLRKVQFGQMDALQVLGNQTLFLGSYPMERFRNLPYYALSSSEATAELHLQLTRSELIFGWLALRTKNWKEMVIANGMANVNQPHFWELGYGLDDLFRFAHAEVVYSKLGTYKGEWRVLVGGRIDLDIRPRTFNRNP